jgi:hypothetical protein
MRGVIKLYSDSNQQVVPMLYQMKFGPFMQREIQKGDKTVSKYQGKDKDEKELINKYRKRDSNIKVNIQIAQYIQYVFKFMFDCVNSDCCDLPKNEVILQIKDLMILLKMLLSKLDQELLHHMMFALKNINEMVFDYKAIELKEVFTSYCTMLKEIVFQ